MKLNIEDITYLIHAVNEQIERLQKEIEISEFDRKNKTIYAENLERYELLKSKLEQMSRVDI